MSGSGGEFMVSGNAALIGEPELRAIAARAASYQPADRYILFELSVSEARGNVYGDEPHPTPRRWIESTG